MGIAKEGIFSRWGEFWSEGGECFPQPECAPGAETRLGGRVAYREKKGWGRTGTAFPRFRPDLRPEEGFSGVRRPGREEREEPKKEGAAAVL